MHQSRSRGYTAKAMQITSRAAAAIEQHGLLLVFPITNRPEPRSLWSVLHPRTRMRWEWDQGGDSKVVELWHAREQLARSGKVVYAKWFRGRATFFSRKVFGAMLSSLKATGPLSDGLSPQARHLLDLLEDNSPLSTKQLRRDAEMQGRAMEATYTRALKELWSRLLVVGVGEVNDGAFPSLAMGATKLLFEDLWLAADEAPLEGDAKLLAMRLPAGSAFRRELDKVRDKLHPH
jgi:hypothetical protein